MKYLIPILLLSFLTSCSGTKKVTENKSKPEVIEETTTVKKVDTLVIKEPKAKEDSQNLEITEEEVNKDFNQTLSKRFITAHQLWDELLVKYVSNNGIVNYKSFKTNRKKLLDYIHTLNLMFSNEAFQTLTKEDKLAFWINAYNAMTIDLILRHYPVKSIKDIDKPWDKRYWKLGNKWYNLNEIEHNILRKMNEPKIHFAIVCASVSCPKLLNKAFTASNLEEQLTRVTKDFLSDSTKNNISKDNVKLSKIFQWFAKDFKQDGSLIDFLNQYSDVKISAKAKKSYKDYNWYLNE